ncbi:MAG: COX15/CtaA family protein [Opitutaceae bacterium]|nr:COX15/CtaA family protein [Cytophagales bacterium]
MHTNTSTFRKLVLTSVLLIYLVIAAGGIVRSTGSGMGCPDWPKCFGTWIPPTNISQLPANYKESFKVGHHLIADFNVFKTWIEYLNRLLGALLGVSVLVTAVYAFRFIRSKPELFYLSLLIVILTGIQGFIGAKVVATNLSKYMITIHMLIALVILSLTLYLLSKTIIQNWKAHFENGNLILLLSVLTLIQILVGTQVRQEIDTVSIQLNDSLRETWIDQLGILYIIHRVIAIFVVGVNVWFASRLLKKLGSGDLPGKLSLLIIFTLALEYVFGVIMAKFSIPRFAQPVHLFLATLLFGLQFYSWLISRLQVEKNLNAI